MAGRASVVGAVAQQVAERRGGRPLRVGIDGIVGAGKSTFARDLVDELRSRGHSALHLDSDGFHHVRAIRRRNTADPARGYYEDAYDFASLTTHVLDPIEAGQLTVATKVHDLDSDDVVSETTTLAPDAIVVVDATFVQRDDLRRRWDVVVWLEVTRTTALQRGIERDRGALGGRVAARRAYETRYMAACDLYVVDQDPRRSATIVVDHEDPAHPRLIDVDR